MCAHAYIIYFLEKKVNRPTFKIIFKKDLEFAMWSDGSIYDWSLSKKFTFGGNKFLFVKGKVTIYGSPQHFFRKVGGGGGVIERDGAGRLVDPIKTIVPMNKDHLDLQSNFSWMCRIANYQYLQILQFNEGVDPGGDLYTYT